LRTTGRRAVLHDFTSMSPTHTCDPVNANERAGLHERIVTAVDYPILCISEIVRAAHNVTPVTYVHLTVHFLCY
jgi:hypothetical protein